MLFSSKKLEAIKPSATISISSKTRELIESGKDIINLAMGEPDFNTPNHIIEAAKSALDMGETRYTAVNGSVELRNAICKKFKRDNQLNYNIEQIHVSGGGKPVIFNALMATLNVGDEVIIPAPYWVSYPDITLLFDAVPVIVECPESAGYKIAPEQLESSITSKTRWLILNSPSNPTGAAYTKDELKALAAVLLKHPNILIFSDDIYEHLIYDDVEFVTMAQVEPKLWDRTLTMNGMSKAYCMTGWRLGYAGGPTELIKAMTKVQSQSISHACSISQAATVAALNGSHEFMYMNNHEYKMRRDLVVDMLNEAIGLSCEVPAGAFYAYPNCKMLIGKQTTSGKVIHNDEDFVLYLLEHGVATVHGAAFGMSPHFRVSYAASLSDLERACKRIQNACRLLV